MYNIYCIQIDSSHSNYVAFSKTNTFLQQCFQLAVAKFEEKCSPFFDRKNISKITLKNLQGQTISKIIDEVFKDYWIIMFGQLHQKEEISISAFSNHTGQVRFFASLGTIWQQTQPVNMKNIHKSL